MLCSVVPASFASAWRGVLGEADRPFCFTSTEARLLIRDGEWGGRGGGGRKSEGSAADTAEKDRRDRGPQPEQWKC